MGRMPNSGDQTPSHLSAGVYQYDEAYGFFVGDVRLSFGPQVSRLLAAVMQEDGKLVRYDTLKKVVQSTSDNAANVFGVQFHRAKKEFERLGVAFPIATVAREGRCWTGPPVSTDIKQPVTGASVFTVDPSATLADFVTKIYIVDAWAAGPLPTEPRWGHLTMTPSGWIVKSDSVTDSSVVVWGPNQKLGAVAATTGRTVGFGVTLLGWERFAQSPRLIDAPLVKLLHEETAPAKFGTETSPLAIVGKLESHLLSILEARPPKIPQLQTIEHALRLGPKTVPEFAQFAGMSGLQLQDTCKLFRVTPSRLLRLRRFHKVIKRLSAPSIFNGYDEIRPDYCNRVHFNRDYLDFMTYPAGLYFSALQKFPEMIDMTAIDCRLAGWSR